MSEPGQYAHQRGELDAVVAREQQWHRDYRWQVSKHEQDHPRAVATYAEMQEHSKRGDVDYQLQRALAEDHFKAVIERGKPIESFYRWEQWEKEGSVEQRWQAARQTVRETVGQHADRWVQIEHKMAGWSSQVTRYLQGQQEPRRQQDHTQEREHER